NHLSAHVAGSTCGGPACSGRQDQRQVEKSAPKLGSVGARGCGGIWARTTDKGHTPAISSYTIKDNDMGRVANARETRRTPRQRLVQETSGETSCNGQRL